MKARGVTVMVTVTVAARFKRLLGPRGWLRRISADQSY